MRKRLSTAAAAVVVALAALLGPSVEASADVATVDVYRRDLGGANPHPFYVRGQAEAQAVGARFAFRTWAATPSDGGTYFLISRCYDVGSGVHYYRVANGPCEEIGQTSEGDIGWFRSRDYRSSPDPNLGVPLYAMQDRVARNSAGFNVYRTLFTNTDEAAARCGDGLGQYIFADPNTCFVGYVPAGGP